jgi:putative ABC transport system substrate-binding protein
MRRREFVVASLVCFGSASATSEPQKLWRLGFLSPGYRDQTFGSRITAVEELGRRGFVEGKNLVVDARFAEGLTDRLPELARELAKERPDAVIAVSNPAIRAARQAAPDTPIVMAFAGEDPVNAGLVSSLPRPGGMVTGIALLAAEADAKRVELITHALPGAQRLALLATLYAEHDRIGIARGVAKALGLELLVLQAQNTGDYKTVFGELARFQPAALVIGSSPVFFRDVTDLADRAAALSIPTICEWREMAERGCTYSYGPNLQGLYRTIGSYVARIFNGERPSELPVEQPTKFELVINLKRARELGAEPSPTFLARADEVIE